MPPSAELKAFLVHLRWPYQVLVLSGGFLLGGLFCGQLVWLPFLLQFLNVHLLLNGGVTAYNSFWDKDEGPIGGVEHPPPMTPWMHSAAMALQALSLVLAAPMGVIYTGLVATTIVLSALYSAPWARWKGHPLLSFLAVGVGTGMNTFLMGYLAGGGTFGVWIVQAAAGVALLLLSMYPVSQVFQVEEDQARGDRSFAVAFGLRGVRIFFVLAYSTGLAVVGWMLSQVQAQVGLAFWIVGGIGGVGNAGLLFSLRGRPEEYKRVMTMKYLASLSFVLFIVVCLGLTQLGIS